jgi:hypothetical protein
VLAASSAASPTANIEATATRATPAAPTALLFGLLLRLPLIDLELDLMEHVVLHA